MKQILTPDLSVTVVPNYCLMNVRIAFGVQATGKYPTAISNYQASQTKHTDQNFPAGCYVPIWFDLKSNPAGHVAIMAPDGSIYSSSSPSADKFVRHTSLDDMNRYWGGVLDYLGWTEDVEDTKVIQEDDDMASPEQIDDLKQHILLLESMVTELLKEQGVEDSKIEDLKAHVLTAVQGK